MADFAIIFLVWVGFILNFVLAELIAHGTYKVYQVRYQIQWSARHFPPLFASLVWSVAFLLIERNLQYLGSVALYFDLGAARWILHNIFSIGFLGIYGLRCWLVHFDYHTGVAMFVRVTNIKLTEEEEEHFDWFLANKSNYGSPKYLNHFLSIMLIVLNIALFGWSIITPATFYYGMIGTYACLILIIMGVAKKITVMDDEFFIRRELLLEFRILGAFFILTGIFIMFGPVMGWPYATYFIVQLSCFAIAGMAGVSTWWMLDKSQLFTIPLLMEQKLKERGEEVGLKGVPPLRVVLADKVAVATFLKHLIRELSVENLFFLADVMHFKKAFTQNDAGQLNEITGFFIDVPDLLARYAYIPERTFTQYAWAISKAYVDNISAFYVTALDDDIREEILDYLEKLNYEEEPNFDDNQMEALSRVFDEAAKQVYALVKQAYKRFSKTPKFKQLNMDDRAGGIAREMQEVTGGNTTQDMPTNDPTREP